MNILKIKRALAELVWTGALLFAAASVFLRPGAAAGGVLRGLSVCYETVIPALFPFLVLSRLLLESRAASHSSPPSARMILSCKDRCIFTRFLHNMKTGPRLYPARRREPFGRVQARAFLFSAFVIFPPASARKPPAARRCTPTRRVRPRRRPAPHPPRLLHRTRG